MHDPRKSESSERASDAPRSPEKSRAEVPLPLGGGAFASPLVWPSSPQNVARRRYRLAAIALVSAGLLAVGIIGVALLVSSERTATANHARAESTVLRAEVPSEMGVQRAPSLTTKRASARLSPIPSAPIARTSKTTAATAATPAAGSVLAQPTVQAGHVARSAREPGPRKARVDRVRRASPPAPVLPEELTRAQVIEAMRKVTPAVDACFGSTHGKANVTFSVVGKTGRVVGARVTGKTGKVGSCIARSVRRARFPKFAKPRIDISYPFAR